MQHGFTLIEITVALAVMAILAVVAVPGLAATQGRTAAAAAAQRFALTLRAAQARAGASGEAVEVAVAPDGSDYQVLACSADGSRRCVESGSFAPAGAASNYPSDTVVFTADGYPCGASRSPRAGTFIFTCAGSAASVVIQLAGRVRCR